MDILAGGTAIVTLAALKAQHFQNALVQFDISMRAHEAVKGTGKPVGPPTPDSVVPMVTRDLIAEWDQAIEKLKGWRSEEWLEFKIGDA